MRSEGECACIVCVFVFVLVCVSVCVFAFVCVCMFSVLVCTRIYMGKKAASNHVKKISIRPFPSARPPSSKKNQPNPSKKITTQLTTKSKRNPQHLITKVTLGLMHVPLQAAA